MLRIPPFDLRAKPEARTARAEIEYRTRHIRPPALVLADGVPVG
jgi:hypothetical protein